MSGWHLALAYVVAAAAMAGLLAGLVIVAQRRRRLPALPRYADRTSTVTAYSAMAWLLERDTAKAAPRAWSDWQWIDGDARRPQR